MKTLSLAEKYRPETFGDVFGQEAASSYLLDQVQADAGRSVLLFGPAGSGKTSLAEAYAAALLCPTLNNRPCGSSECESCQYLRTGNHPNLKRLRHGHIDDVEFAKRVDRSVRLESFGSGRLVVLVEQAQLMSMRAFDILHEEMARPYLGVTFILCCEDQDQVPAKARALFYPLPLHARTAKAQSDYLSFLCREEKVSFDSGALELLSEYTGGSFRDLARDLEVLMNEGSITLQSVERLFGRKLPSRYVSLVFERKPFAQQVAFLDEWSAPAPDKVRQVGDYLSTVFRTHIGSRADRISLEQRAEFATDLNRCLSSLKEQPTLFARKLLQIWDPEPAMGPTTLLRKASEFEDLVSGVSIGDHERASDIVDRWQVTAERRQRYSRETKREAKVSSVQSVETPETKFLNLDEAKELWHSASFMVQAYGALLNTRILIRHEHLRPHKKGGSEQHLTDFGRELRDFVNRAKLSADDHLHWLYVHQNDPKDGLITRIAAHFPPCATDVSNWILNKFFRRRALAMNPETPVQIELFPKSQPLAVHLNLIRQLCAGLAPSDRANLAFFNRTQIDHRLGWVPGDKITSQRKGVSRLIDVDAQRKAGNDLKVIFAIEKRDVDACSGWELEQYEYRKMLIDERNGLEKVAMQHADHELRLRALREQWAKGEKLREAGRPLFS